MRETSPTLSPDGSPQGGCVVAVYCAESGRLCAEGTTKGFLPLLVERGTCPRASTCCGVKPEVGVVGDGDENTLGQALTRFGCCVERRFDLLEHGRNLAPTLEQGGLYMALSTALAYATAPAHLFTEALVRRLGLDAELNQTIETALHEALANALVHGNLGLDSQERDSIEGLLHYCQSVEERLAEEERAARRVEVFAVWNGTRVLLSVVDEGAGYHAEPTQETSILAKAGRGLSIIRALAEDVVVEEGGRKISMSFRT